MYDQLNNSYENIPQSSGYNKSYEINNNNNNIKNNKYLKLIAFVSFIISITIVIITNKNNNILHKSLQNFKNLQSLSYEEIFKNYDLTNQDLNTFSISVSSPGYSTLKSLDHLPWNVLAEPYKTQVITINSLKINGKEINLSTEVNILFLFIYCFV